MSPVLDIHLQIRKALVEPEYIIKTKQVAKITKMYPVFNLSETVQKGVIPEISVGKNTSAKTADVSPTPKKTPAKPAPAQKPKPQPKTAQPQPAATKAPAAKKGPVDANLQAKFNALSQTDKDDPDNEMNFVCSISVMDFKIKQLEEQIKNIEGRTPRELRTKLVSLKCKKNFFENSVGDGTLSPQQVLDLQKGQLEKDRLLLEYFNHIGDAKKANMVKSRIPYLMQDIKDMEEIVKG